jgi:molybdopterin-guanine dinucleotide biosynthesis protein A
MSGLRAAGVILCGGRSTRMGQPKAWLPFGPETLLQRVVRLVGSVVDPLVVVAAPEQPLPALPASVRVVRDPAEGRGPLQGIAVGLAALVGQAECAYVTACDAPLLRPAFVRRLLDLLGTADAIAVRTDEYTHPLSAVYRVHAQAPAQALLDAGQARPLALLQALSTHFITAAELADVDPHLESLRNLNTPAEYAAALRDVG